MNPYLSIVSISSDKSAKAMTSADITENPTCLNLSDLCDIEFALLISTVNRTMRPSCDDASELLSSAPSL